MRWQVVRNLAIGTRKGAVTGGRRCSAAQANLISELAPQDSTQESQAMIAASQDGRRGLTDCIFMYETQLTAKTISKDLE